MGRKTIIQSISFQPDVWNYLEKKPNISELVNEAVREHKRTKTSPELKVKQLKDKKRELIKKINGIDEEVKRLKG